MRAVNDSGVGMASMASDPVTAKAVPGNIKSQTERDNYINIFYFCLIKNFSKYLFVFKSESTTKARGLFDALFLKEVGARLKRRGEWTNILKNPLQFKFKLNSMDNSFHVSF